LFGVFSAIIFQQRLIYVDETFFVKNFNCVSGCGLDKTTYHICYWVVTILVISGILFEIRLISPW